MITNLFWKNLNDIQSHLNLSHEEMARLLHMPTSKFSKAKFAQKDISLLNVSQFADFFNISLDLLLKGKVDTATLKCHYHHQNYDLPQRFHQSAKSPAFAFRNLLKVSEIYQKKDLILKTLQISEKYLATNPKYISLLAITEGCKLMKNFFTTEDYKFIGRLSALELKDEHYGYNLKQNSSLPDLYEMAILLEHNNSKNWTYQIRKINSRYAIVDSYCTQKLSNSKQFCRKSGHFLDLIRIGFAETLPRYINCSNTKISLRKSIFHGDQYSRFFIDFTQSMKLPPSKKI
ncbi:MAG: helix-turn-helix transcriptional regulator [Bacteriovoracaceae bacterium]|jgi:hypothetical protein|nr:hypothetical protein [Halobacteriovoraceae bacterium]MDP7319394.1 helix-turn-helix transcriptional regulator [Bacteriovoracaceae bacterium]|tara:strand:+ start:189 stop:1055 length:867 start_codon:yes stop_codon:yes gene_type:complete